MPDLSAPAPAKVNARFRTPGERFVIVRRRDRLGARLLAFLASWRLARTLDAHLVMYWADLDHTDPSMPADEQRMGHLFDLEELALKGLNREFTIIEGYRSAPTGVRAIEADPATAEAWRRGMTSEQAFAHGQIIETVGDGVLRLAGETREQAAAEIAALYDLLPMRAPIARALKRFDASLRGSPFAVLHVRRGDILNGLRNAIKRLGEPRADDADLMKFARYYALRCAPLGAALRRLDEVAGPEAKVAVMGDSPAFVARAEAGLAPARLVDVASFGAPLKSVQRALFEINVMRGATHVVGAASAFSRLASLIGPVDLVMETGTVAERLSAFEAEALDVAPREAHGRWIDFYKAILADD